MASAMEEHVRKITRLDVSRFPIRQDLLAGYVRAIDKLDDKAFGKLTDEAIDWHTDAVKKMDNKKNLPEFPDLEEEVEEADEVDEEADEEAEIEEQEQEAEEADEEQDHEAETEAEADNEAVEAAEETKPKKGSDKPAAKPKAPKRDRTTRYDKLSMDKDEFGFVLGTKVCDAMQLYKKGATVKDVEKAMGSRFFNCLKTAEKRGHTIEREGNVWTATPQGAAPAKAAPKAAKKGAKK